MTLTQAARAWREEQTRRPPTRGQPKNKRFAGKNALVDGRRVAALTLNELRVVFVIDRFLNADGTARLSHTTIAQLAGMRREHVARTTARLEQQGVLRVLERGRRIGESGKRTANIYEILALPPNTDSAIDSTIADTN